MQKGIEEEKDSSNKLRKNVRLTKEDGMGVAFSEEKLNRLIEKGQQLSISKKKIQRYRARINKKLKLYDIDKIKVEKLLILADVFYELGDYANTRNILDLLEKKLRDIHTLFCTYKKGILSVMGNTSKNFNAVVPEMGDTLTEMELKQLIEKARRLFLDGRRKWAKSECVKVVQSPNIDKVEIEELLNLEDLLYRLKRWSLRIMLKRPVDKDMRELTFYLILQGEKSLRPFICYKDIVSSEVKEISVRKIKGLKQLMTLSDLSRKTVKRISEDKKLKKSIITCIKGSIRLEVEDYKNAYYVLSVLNEKLNSILALFYAYNGRMLYAQGNLKGAVKYFHLSLGFNPNNDEINTLINQLKPPDSPLEEKQKQTESNIVLGFSEVNKSSDEKSGEVLASGGDSPGIFHKENKGFEQANSKAESRSRHNM